MAKKEKVLSEISLNTPMRKSLASLETGKFKSDDKLTHFSGGETLGFVRNGNNTQSDKDFYLVLNNFCKNPSVNFIDQVRISLTALYTILKRNHQIQKIKELTKQHLMVIIKLLEINELNHASYEILALYNNTNSKKTQDFGEILLCDFSISNKYYISTLKILILQVILKNEGTNRYLASILEMFSKDERYLLKDPSLKVHTVVKLLLNFFSIIPQYKVLFALKFLQYVQKFNLDFKIFIKNMDLLTFQEQIIKISKKCYPHSLRYIQQYYYHYSKFVTTFDKIMFNDLMINNDYNKQKLLIMDLNNTSTDDIEIQLNHKGLLSFKDHERIIHFINNLLLKKPDASFKFLKFITKFIKLINQELPSLRPIHTGLFDNIIIFINDNLPILEGDKILSLLKELSNCCIDYQDYKRLKNVINVSFNSFVVNNYFASLQLAMELQIFYYTCVEQNVESFEKFTKFLSGLSQEQKILIFSQFANIHILFDDCFGTLYDICKIRWNKAFKKLKLTKFNAFVDCSDVMLCLLYSDSGIEGIPYENWSTLPRMLFQMLDRYTQSESIVPNEKVNKIDCFSKHEHLIKTMYYLHVEMRSHSSLKLSEIVRMLIINWIDNLPKNEVVSELEVIFIENLFEYLNFNKFFKKIIELVEKVKIHSNYYFKILPNTEIWLLNSYLSLGLVKNTIKQCETISKVFNFNSNDLLNKTFEHAYNYCNAQLLLIYWKKNFDEFNKHFVTNILISRPEFFDINNDSNMSMKQYLKVLLFNIKREKLTAYLHFNNNNFVDSLIELKKALKLCQTLIKIKDKIPQDIRIELTSLLVHLFTCIINIYIQTGVSKDCDYYVKELNQIVCGLRDYTPIFDGLTFIHNYYKLFQQSDLLDITLSKANNAFNYLDGTENINSLAKFFYQNGEVEKLINSINLFFSNGMENSFLYYYWRLKAKLTIPDTLGNNKLKLLNDINGCQELYERVMVQMNRDPFFKMIFDSVMSLPSCFDPISEDIDLDQSYDLSTPNCSPHRSPPPSSLMPRINYIRRNFDKSNVINILYKLKELINLLDFSSMKNYDIKNMASLYSLSVSILSSITILTNPEISIIQSFALKELPKSMPLYYDKLFSTIGNEIYKSFMPKIINEKNSLINIELHKLKNMHKSFIQSSASFNIITFDICEYSGDLLLTKMNSDTRKVVNLRLPLNRHNSRDLINETLDFHSAISELNSIIEENNITTSLEVTRTIKTKQEKREWWEKRYSLDARMGVLLTRIQSSWICGFEGFFLQEKVDSSLFEEFKTGFQNILQQNLPTRKTFGKPSQFLQIEDHILELFLKLDLRDSRTEEIIQKLDDLIYFVFDILLFHGEENAYDEVDTHIIHVQIQELIDAYKIKAHKQPSISHTFLVISSTCHLIPWESLSFFQGVSISRLPSVRTLEHLLTKFNHMVFPKVDLKRNISMILNPHGDLLRTEEFFKSKFDDIHHQSQHSKLIIGEKPTEMVFLDMITNSNLFIYIGHGGGEQYIRSKCLKLCDKIAPSFLLGCSSAYMKHTGKLEPNGIMYSYLIGGCPMVVGNLWDVTDKDIDKFSRSMFKRIGLFDDTLSENVALAISNSRNVCHLKYLNGASPVVYGLPFMFYR